MKVCLRTSMNGMFIMTPVMIVMGWFSALLWLFSAIGPLRIPGDGSKLWEWYIQLESVYIYIYIYMYISIYIYIYLGFQWSTEIEVIVVMRPWQPEEILVTSLSLQLEHSKKQSKSYHGIIRQQQHSIVIYIIIYIIHIFIVLYIQYYIYIPFIPILSNVYLHLSPLHLHQMVIINLPTKQPTCLILNLENNLYHWWLKQVKHHWHRIKCWLRCIWLMTKL